LGKARRRGTVERAAQIGEYYAAHALGAFDDMGADLATRNARTILRWIERTATSAFTKREVFRAAQSSQFKTMADLDPALTVLETHGYLRQLDQSAPKRAGGRPPSPSYLVHPEVHRPAATVHPLAARRAS
jgi:replicative DNA helicase